MGLYRILFVCLGNICRSPMAEFICRDLLEKKGLSDCCEVASAATSPEELGNPVYPPAAAELQRMGLSCKGKRARLMTREDGEVYDLLIGMEERNLRRMRQLVEERHWPKIHKLLSFAGSDADIADPWYSGDFVTVRKQILQSCEALIDQLEKDGKCRGRK